MAAPARGRRPARVAEAIKDWVVVQGLAQGDRLPGEAELMDRFGMSKGTIREAMRLLEAQGLVVTRTGPGGGSFVDAVSERRARALLGNYFYFKNLTVADIYQLRRVLEPELAASLAGNLSEAELALLERTIAEYAAPPSTAEEERAQHVTSLRFHAELAACSGNDLLRFVIGFLSQVLSDMTVHRRLYEPPNFQLWQQGRRYQADLVAALRAGDAPAARQIMLNHMRTAQTLMEAQEVEVGKRFIGP